MGDPDHICDLVAAGIADEYLRRDPETRIRCNVSGGRGAIFVTGEILTQADFDVSHLVQRLLGQCGVYEQLEPFIALEPVSSDKIGYFRQACPEPTLINGYATRESEDLTPAPIYWARKIAQALEGRRKHDPDWFWLGAPGKVSVSGQGKQLDEVVIEIDHAAQPLDLVRAAISQELEDQGIKIKLQVNILGDFEKGGIESCIGSRRSHLHAYGYGLPPITNPAGLDWHAAEVYGAWYARYLAKEILRTTQAQAVMTELFFKPGDLFPTHVSARDEKGRDLSKQVQISKDGVSKLLDEWRGPGMMNEIVRLGVMGHQSLPWERGLSTLPVGLLV